MYSKSDSPRVRPEISAAPWVVGVQTSSGSCAVQSRNDRVARRRKRTEPFIEIGAEAIVVEQSVVDIEQQHERASGVDTRPPSSHRKNDRHLHATSNAIHRSPNLV
jgi:hypothetical protein